MPQKKKTRTGQIRWIARWREADGTEKSKSFATKSAAKAHEASVAAEITKGTYVPAAAGDITLKNYLIDLEQRRSWRAGTAKHKHDAVDTLPFADKPIGKITRADVEKWTVTASKTMSATTVRVRVSTVRGIFTAAVRDGRIVRNPVPPSSELNLPKAAQKISIPDDKEISTLLDNAVSDAVHVAILLGADAGLRAGEALGLRWSDVDLDTKVIHVRQQGLRGTAAPLKTSSSERTVPMSPRLAAWLKDHRQVGGYVVGGRVEPMHQNGLDYLWRGTLDKAKVTGRRFHDLRHAFVSRLVRRGLTAKEVAAAAGHGSVQTTLNTYVHLWHDSEDRLRAAIAGQA